MYHIVNFDPIAFNIFGFDVYWYGLAYLAGIIFGSMYISYLDKKSTNILNKELIDHMIVYLILGIILGGRFGYLIFYSNGGISWQEIFSLRIRGMSFHGGFIGTVIALIIFCYRNKISKLLLADLIFVATPFGIMLGRLANFINGELFGRITNVSWAMIFENGGPYPRHPSQLYEAMLEGLIPLILLSILRLRFSLYKYKGLLSGFYISWYGISRIIVENFREPDPQLGFIFFKLTMGQILSIPMILIGLYLIIQSRKNIYAA